ncbi:MAG: putative ABC transporter permease [Roseburia sp.]|nr:putative ABC transporter permease [Roseburia sp.]
MPYTYSELLWLFFIYSFLGWVLETTTAAIKQKRFTNRGLVNLPFCIIYGLAAVFISIFGAELSGIWLYIGSVILATVFEWIAGHIIEKIYHERWWDYSNRKFNLDGYICLQMSALWGALAFVMMKWGNTLLLNLLHLLPKVSVYIILTILSVLMALDVLATLVALSNRDLDKERWIAIDSWLSKLTSKLGQRIYNRINARIKRAYPDAKKSIISPTDKVKTGTTFAVGCGFHKIVWLFMIGAFLGDITETIYCRITAGVWMSRSSVVWGPFSIVWGLAIAAATALLHRYRDKSDAFLFAIGTFLGGAYEYVCSVFTEMVFGKVFWDYSSYPLNLGGRINLLYCFFWGIAAVVWMKYLYPKISGLIEKVPAKTGKIITWVMTIFMCCNMLVSSMALIRSTERANHIPAEFAWQQLMDEHYDDATLQRIYPNALSTD